jgi:signal peptide peptidase SppA
MRDHRLFAVSESHLADVISKMQETSEDPRILELSAKQDRPGVYPVERAWYAERASRIENGMGIIAINGTLTSDDGTWYGIPYKMLANLVTSMDENASVKCILLDIKSPGGHIAGLIEFSNILHSCKKPVYSYCEGLCASAAYLIASATKRIYATRQTMIGSIGVIAVALDYSTAYERQGVKERIFRSKNASKKNLDPFSDEGAGEIQKSVDEAEDFFIGEIANNRGVTTEDAIGRFGKGLTFHAEEAKARGMVDEIVSGFDMCVKKIMPSLTGVGGVVVVESAERVALTIETLRAQHPDLASLLVEEGRVAGFDAGKMEGATAERLRIVSLTKLKGVECGAEVVEKAVENGDSVEMAKSAILDRQLESGKNGGVKPTAKISIADIAAESAEANVDPVEPTIASTKDAVIDSAVAKATAAFDAKFKTKLGKKE